MQLVCVLYFSCGNGGVHLYFSAEAEKGSVMSKKLKNGMKYPLLFLICICGLSCLIFLLINHKGRPINANEGLRLSENEIIELSEKAKNGDGEAAVSLGIYYEAIEKDREKAAEWFKLGADNGDAVCQWNYAGYLEDTNNMDEAIIYLKMAAENGDEFAKRRLEKLKISRMSQIHQEY